MEINNIFKNQELTEKISNGEILDKQNLCKACNCTSDEADNLFSEIRSVCNSVGVDVSNLEAGDLDKVSGGLGLPNNTKTCAVIAGLLTMVTACSGFPSASATAVPEASYARQAKETENSFDEITKAAAVIKPVMKYRTFHIYSKEEREESRETVEKLIDLAATVSKNYSENVKSGRSQLAAQNLDVAALNSKAVLGKDFVLDRNAVYNYGVCDRDLRSALTLYEKAVATDVVAKRAHDQMRKEANLKEEEKTREKIRAEFDSKKKIILNSYASIRGEAENIISGFEAQLTRDRNEDLKGLLNDLKDTLQGINKKSEELQKLEVNETILNSTTLDEAKVKTDEELNQYWKTYESFETKCFSAKKKEQIIAEFVSKKKVILNEYKSIKTEAETVLRSLEKTLTRGNTNDQDELTTDLKSILKDITEPYSEVQNMRVPEKVLSSETIELAQAEAEDSLKEHWETCQALMNVYSAVKEEAAETMRDLNEALLQCSKDEYQARLETIEQELPDKFVSQGLNETRTAKVQKILEDIYAELAIKKDEVKNYNDIKNQNKIKRSLESFDRFISSKEAVYRSVLDQHQADLNKIREQQALRLIREAVCYPQARDAALSSGLLKFEDLVCGFPKYDKIEQIEVDEYGNTRTSYVEQLNSLEKFMEAYDKTNQSEPEDRGLILYGPPGTGKTTQVKYLALSKGYNVLTLSREVLSNSKETPARVIRDYYETAKNIARTSNTVTVLLLDEIDSMGYDRSKTSAGEDGPTNELMNIAETNTKSDGVAIIGTTNYYNKLDKALTRRGRMGLSKEVNPPSDVILWEIFRSRVKHFPAQNCNDVEQFLADVKSHVALTGATPADVDEWCCNSIKECRNMSPQKDLLKTVLRSDIFTREAKKLKLTTR